MEQFRASPGVAFVAIQTVFEGFEVNTAERARETAEKYQLTIPVGHDPGPDGRRGYGGHCLPKDAAAWCSWASGSKHSVVAAAQARNVTTDRPEQDWKADKGRAVV